MSREEIQKLLGGYATDTLSEAERSALFAAALEDQELFDALAREQELQEVLQYPAARQQLMAALGPEREALGARFWRWMRRPAGLALAGGVAALFIVSGVLMFDWHERSKVKLVASALETTGESALPAAAPKVFQPPVARPRKRPAPVLQAPPALEAKNEPAAPAARMPMPAPPPLPAATPPQMAIQVTAPRAMAASNMKRAKAQFQALEKPAINYTILVQGADGSYNPAPAGTTLHVGDLVRIRVTATSAGQVSLLQRDAQMGWQVVATQAVESGHQYVLPQEGVLRSDTPGKIELLLVPGSVASDYAISQAQASSRITLEFH